MSRFRTLGDLYFKLFVPPTVKPRVNKPLRPSGFEILTMPSTIGEVRIDLRDGSPLNTSTERKCPIDDLPNELLSYVFRLGVELEQEDWNQEPEYSKWKHIDEDGSVNSDSATTNRALTDSDSEDDQLEELVILPSQVLVSHICRRWRSIAINTHQFWTRISFRLRPRLQRTKEYIFRSNGIPLTIEIDSFTRYYEDEEDLLSLEELDQILDLLEPAISQWGSFTFVGRSYTHTLHLMSRLNKIPAAPRLQSFRAYNIWNGLDIVTVPADPHLPFHGQAPNLKEAAFRELHIDWEGAVPNFLRGLHDFELSYPKDPWPTYATFTEIISNSPELHTLTLSKAGPLPSDSHAAWGPTPLSIPSLTNLVLRSHDQDYAVALVRHLDLPNVTHLDLDFDTIDYSNLVRTLAQPVKERGQSLLRQITHLNMTGLSFNTATAKILLSELVSLKSLHIQPSRGEDEIVCDALIDPNSLLIGQVSEILPKIFCPKLEEIATSLKDERVKALISGRRDAGVPLKRIRRVPQLLPT